MKRSRKVNFCTPYLCCRKMAAAGQSSQASVAHSCEFFSRNNFFLSQASISDSSGSVNSGFPCGLYHTTNRSISAACKRRKYGKFITLPRILIGQHFASRVTSGFKVTKNLFPFERLPQPLRITAHAA